MRTEDLIVALAADLRPVRPLEPTGVRLGRWAIGAAVSIAVAVLAFGLRADFPLVVGAPWWMSEVAAVVVMVIVAGIAADVSAVPGAIGSRALPMIAAIALGAWAAVLCTRLVSDGGPMAALLREPVHLACIVRMVLVGAIPVAVTWRQLRQAVPLHPARSAALATLAALSAGAVATLLVCPLSQPAHGLLWHVMPLVTLVGVVTWVTGAMSRRVVRSTN